MVAERVGLLLVAGFFLWFGGFTWWQDGRDDFATISVGIGLVACVALIAV